MQARSALDTMPKKAGHDEAVCSMRNDKHPEKWNKPTTPPMSGRAGVKDDVRPGHQQKIKTSSARKMASVPLLITGCSAAKRGAGAK